MSDLTWAQGLAVAALVAAMVIGARNGHRRGPLRQLALPLSGLLALLSASWAGADLGHAFLGEIGVPWLLRAPLGFLMLAALIWLISLALLWRLGKPSAVSGESDHPVLGSLVGCWSGMLAWLIVLVAWGQYAAWEDELRAPGSTGAGKTSWGEIVRLPGLSWLGEMEAWPEKPREIVRLSRRVFADAAATRRLMENPGIKALASHPSFYTAWGDRGVKQLVQNGDYRGLLGHPKVEAVLKDDDFQRDLANFDVLGALRGALATP